MGRLARCCERTERDVPPPERSAAIGSGAASASRSTAKLASLKKERESEGRGRARAGESVNESVGGKGADSGLTARWHEGRTGISGQETTSVKETPENRWRGTRERKTKEGQKETERKKNGQKKTHTHAHTHIQKRVYTFVGGCERERSNVREILREKEGET